MAVLKPLRGWRPPMNIAKLLASRPYDVLDSKEARVEASDNPYCFLRVVKPEIELPPGTNLYSQQVYDKAAENFKKFIKKGYLVRDSKPYFYVYAQTWGKKIQYGLMGCAAVDDYMNGVIKKHELTRPDKEEDRVKHVKVVNANAEPVFFAYHAVDAIDQIVAAVTKNVPVYDFVADDGFGHKLWVIDDGVTIKTLEALFSEVPAFYVADGHHRTAAAAIVGAEKRSLNPEHTGQENYNYFLAVLFPHNQLTIIDYNRVVTDLNNFSKNEFLAKLDKNFVLERKGKTEWKPNKLHTFSMYLGGEWYALEARPGTYNDSDPIGALDVTILSNLILDEILGIKDLRTDKRVDFVGGIRGLGELRRRVACGEMEVAFALYPVSMKQLFDIADSGNIMPPKTTWFEPKLRSGLVVNTLD
ncbi:MAG TPA: DUF1015 family protein [Bacteroidales bacterium]|nr:DUF1015 family protein [Bacteroidales bacterium]